MSKEEKMILFVIYKYGRPIGIQPLYRGIQVQRIKVSLKEFDVFQLLVRLQEQELIQRQDGFWSLTSKGQIALGA